MQKYNPDNLLDTSAEGLALIERYEAFRAAWYRCPAGLWTIGFGSTERHTPGLSRRSCPGPITEERARRLMQRELIQTYELAVERAVEVPLTPQQFSALVSFCYNVGAGALQRSTLLKQLNRGRYKAAAAQFGRWVYSKGQKLLGLVRRRDAEARLFLEDPAAALSVPAEPLEPQPVRPLASFAGIPAKWAAHMPISALALAGRL